jgi:hypothetical protein
MFREGKGSSSKGFQEGLLESQDCFPHISAMLCHAASGEVLLPFVILAKLAELPAELKRFDQSGKLWLENTPKGWQSRASFLIWVVHFVNYMIYYRAKLHLSIRYNRGLLISDGHSSRGCPSAINLLELANFDLLILPSHTTHVLQMFDVVVASPFKHYFT